MYNQDKFSFYSISNIENYWHYSYIKICFEKSNNFDKRVEFSSSSLFGFVKLLNRIPLNVRFTVKPDPPSNCSVINQTADAVEVWCRPGFDGGHAQQFQFEIFDTQSAVLLYNKSGRYPHLRVSQLDSGLKLFIQISAFNLRGRSALVPLEAYTVKIAEKQTGTALQIFSKEIFFTKLQYLELDLCISRQEQKSFFLHNAISCCSN